MFCEERERLTREYHDAVDRILGSGNQVSDMTSAKWREATARERAASKHALEALNVHRKTHGC